ncbi:MAG: hypothetical protein R3C10_15030 [Pirellulales bacterium]|nr:hypothetical protein [Planctomycetales bacterium]
MQRIVGADGFGVPVSSRHLSCELNMYYLLPIEISGSAVPLLLGFFASVAAVVSYLVMGR